MPRLAVNRAFVTPLAAAASALVLPFVLPTYFLTTTVLIYAIAAVGLNLLLGETGLMSFGQGIFFGFGAYGGALVMLDWGWGLIPALATGLVLGAVVAAGVGLLAIRRRGIYFVLLTFAFAEMFAFLVYAESGITGGENGILDVPRPSLHLGPVSIDYSDQLGMYVLAAVVFVLVYAFIAVVVRSRFGSTLRAIRDNEARARAVGYRTNAFKVVAFAISGGVTGLAGTLYTLLLRSVPDTVMQLGTSQDILIMTIVGGTGSLYGSFLGALGVTVLSDEMSSVWPRWRIILGVALVALVLFLNGGLWGGVGQLAGWLWARSSSLRLRLGLARA